MQNSKRNIQEKFKNRNNEREPFLTDIVEDANQRKNSFRESKMLHTWRNQLKKEYFLLEHKDPTVFVFSQWQHSPKPHLLYLIYRWLITVFFVISWIMSILDIPNLNKSALFRAKWLIYLTNWGYTLCFLQSCLCTAMLTIYFLTYKGESGPTAEKDKSVKMRAYKLYWIANVIATDIAFGITILYWSLIYNDKEMPLNAMNIIVHGLNSFVMLLDLWVVAHPVRILHFYIPVLFGLLYVIFSIIYYFAGGTNKREQVYIYTILNWTNPSKTVLVCLGVTVFIIILHFFTYGMYRLRKTTYERLRARKKEEESKLHLSNKKSFNNPVTTTSDLV